ncbi:MAG: hypothetical protein JSV84_16120 [Gemmatimonadota bacterium]|nr:MAG: hypothetical protein JSV84_16120 [Gemmatimonadota bacterium]
MFSTIRFHEKGASIIELLICLVIASVLVTFMTRFFVAQNRISHIEEQVSFMQENVRLAMEIITRDVMNAGTGIPSGEGVFPLIPGDGASGSSDSLVIMANFDYQYTELFEDEQVDQTIHVMNATGFYVGGLLYIEDFDGGAFHTITSITLDTPKEDQITVSQPLNRPFQKDDTVVSPIARVSYGLTWTEQGRPSLVRTVKGSGAKVLAENIEDLQFSFIMSDGSETSQPADMTEVRLVKIQMTARTEKADCEFVDDGYRRRTLESIVQPRNLDLQCHK